MTIKELEKYKPKLESLIQPTNGCWHYLGTKSKSGRGVIRVGKKTINAALMSWQLYNQELLPEGMQVKSSCDNIFCVNPKHLFLARKTFPWRL